MTQTNCDEAGPRDLVSRPDNMDETVLSSLLRGRGRSRNEMYCQVKQIVKEVLKHP